MSAVKKQADKKREKAGKVAEKKVNFEGFFSVTLDDSNVDDLESYVVEDMNCGAMLSEIVQLGYKISIVEQGQGLSYMCSIYGARSGTPDAGWGFSSWAGTSEESLLGAWYKLKHVIGDRTFVEYMDENATTQSKIRFS